MKINHGWVVIYIMLTTMMYSCHDKRESDERQAVVKKWASLDQAVGNITFAADGQAVYSNHPFFSPSIKVLKYDTVSKSAQPFPNKQWNTPRSGDENYFGSVLGVRNDSTGVVWILDMGIWNKVGSKIVGWNTKKNKLERVYPIPPPATMETSQHNDMVVDLKHHVFIIADEGIANGGDGTKAALVIVDMKTGTARRVLEGHRSTLPENTPTVIASKVLSVNKKPLLVGADGITADKANEWLYYAPLNGSKIYRIRIEKLLDTKLASADLDKAVETYSSKPNNGGFSIDEDNNIYLTGLETNSVQVVRAQDRRIYTYVTDTDLLWPDGVSYNAADGYMYVSAAQLHRGALFNGGADLTKKPFFVFRFRPLTTGVKTR